MQSVSLYHDLTGDLTGDDEGCMVQLCRSCVASYRADEHDLQWAGSGDEERQCEGEDCTVTNNPE